MSKLFITILNMSLTASYAILFVMLIRLLLKKAHKSISYALWIVVAFRLLMPLSFESVVSFFPRNTNTAPIPRDIIIQQQPQIHSGINVIDSVVNKTLSTQVADSPVGAAVNPIKNYIETASWIWILGIAILLAYSLISVFQLKKQLKSAELTMKNIYEARNLKTPFVLGIFKPKIYLPADLNEDERQYILLHEQTHINRKDHIIKMISFLIMSVHWFNPLVWVAFRLMNTDMELSCDERVLKELKEDIKKSYATSLLNLAVGKNILNGSPLAFSERNLKGRIKNVLNYRKPGFWGVAVSFFIVAAVVIGLMTNPKTAKHQTGGDTSSTSKPPIASSMPGNDIKNGQIDIETDIADHATYDYDTGSLYIAGLKIFEEFSTEEFGYSNEGSVDLNDNVLAFSMTTSTGTVTGSLDGPVVYFKIDIKTNKIIEKEFMPAPNYIEFDRPEFEKYSEKTIEINDARLEEIGQFFYEFIKEL